MKEDLNKLWDTPTPDLTSDDIIVIRPLALYGRGVRDLTVITSHPKAMHTYSTFEVKSIFINPLNNKILITWIEPDGEIGGHWYRKDKASIQPYNSGHSRIVKVVENIFRSNLH